MPSIYDKGDMQFADEAFDILGFSNTMKYEVFKNTACMMHMGNMTKDFVPVGKEEQAEIKVCYAIDLHHHPSRHYYRLASLYQQIALQ